MSTATRDTPPAGRLRWQRPLIWVAVAAALGAVFTAYLNPDMALDLATRVWSCF